MEEQLEVNIAKHAKVADVTVLFTINLKQLYGHDV